MPEPFSDTFKWGVSTSSYQIEGAVHAAERGESIWDRFSHTPGKIKDGSTGDIACDHYHRYPDDIALMRDIGVNAYCFSVAWPRIVPDGFGPANPAGLDFYDRLVDGLLEAGITPFLKLNHWDLPQTLQEHGGWPQRETAYQFARYARITARRLGDRVKHWITHLEPWVIVFLGHENGMFAPGIRDFKQAVQASHTLLLSHGLAVPVIREHVPDARIGISLDLYPAYAATDRDADAVALKHFDGYRNRWFLDPVAGRGYPEDMLQLYGDAAPQVEPGDMEVIGAELDFLGVNYYSGQRIAADTNAPFGFTDVPDESLPRTFDREIYPVGLYDTLTRLNDNYDFPAYYITENGSAWDDIPGDDGIVHDSGRVAFIQSHLQQAARAVADGVPLKGMFIWSLMDNFEWAAGYTIRYGICHVDYDTQQRTLKDSARWYRDFLAGQAVLP